MRAGFCVDLVVGARDRLALVIEVIDAGRNEIGGDGDKNDQNEQDRVRARHLEPVLLFLRGAAEGSTGVGATASVISLPPQRQPMEWDFPFPGQAPDRIPTLAAIASIAAALRLRASWLA